MQIDQVVWQVINHHHCSFKVKTPTQNFCRNQYNVSGLCCKSACPLANGQYATIKQQKGVCYLYMKTVERAHTPAKLWEKVKLDKNYEKALQQIDQNLAYWQPYLIHKCKQRLTKLRQMLIRMRKMKLEGQAQIVTVKKKAQKRDRVREEKALRAAHLQLQIEQELLERLKGGVYDEIYSFNSKAFNKALDQMPQQQQQQSQLQEQWQDENSQEALSDQMPEEQEQDQQQQQLAQQYNF